MEMKHARTTNSHTSDVHNFQTKLDANCNTKRLIILLNWFRLLINFGMQYLFLLMRCILCSVINTKSSIDTPALWYTNDDTRWYPLNANRSSQLYVCHYGPTIPDTCTHSHHNSNKIQNWIHILRGVMKYISILEISHTIVNYFELNKFKWLL